MYAGIVALQRSCVPAAERLGTTSRRPASASKTTAWTRPASSGTTATRMVSKSARTLPPAAEEAMPRSVIIMPITLLSPSGSRPSRCTTVVVRRFGFCQVAPFLLAASR
ncbi:hypothetical protein [Streptomyces microflavus]|uniref:hypothetical protein n=1 Tax=Streptomyces microflavus TaxID=1919 RepID=UPI0038190E1D